MKFTIGQILSMGTARLCCPMEEVYEIANFLTGDNLFTHQLVRAFKVCQPWVRSQFPWLAEISNDCCTPETVKQFVADMTAKHGETLELEPLPFGAWEGQDPIDELIRMVGKEKVIVVTHPEDMSGNPAIDSRLE